MGMLGINNAVGMIYVSGFLLPPFFPEWKEWPTVTVDKTYADWLLLLLSCVAGVAIGWSAINAQFYVSATTMLVITNLNKVLLAFTLPSLSSSVSHTHSTSDSR